VTGKQAKITQTSTLYLGEVVLNGHEKNADADNNSEVNIEDINAIVKIILEEHSGDRN